MRPCISGVWVRASTLERRGVLLVAMLIGAGCSGAPGAPASLDDVTLGSASGAFGFHVCAPRALHGCVARAGTRHGTRVFRSLDIEAVSDCATQSARAAERCGPPAGPASLGCHARMGVLLDVFAEWDRSEPAVAPGRFTLTCAEGEAHIDFIEPL
jgi:hypothetical protein